MKCHSHVETRYFETDDLEKLGQEQTKLSAQGYDCEVEDHKSDDEAIRPTRYVITATRQVCQCRCIDCGAAVQKTKRGRSK